MEPKDNIIWPSFKRQFNTAVSGDNTVRKAVPYLDRYQQEQLERQQERQKRWEKQIHKRAVQKEFEEVADYWIDLGVDGFRMDAAMHYEENATNANCDILNKLYTYCKEKNPQFYMVSEVWASENVIADYYASGTPSMFNFDAGTAKGALVNAVRKGDPVSLVNSMLKYQNDFSKKNPDYIDAPFYTNHDMGRSAGYYNGDNAEEKTKMAQAMNLLMPGNAFLYYGEEIGMRGTANDETKRLAMRWSGDSKAKGMCVGPQNAEETEQTYDTLDKQMEDPYSIYNFVKQTISIRNAFPEIARGTNTFEKDLSNDNVCIFTREYNGEKAVLIFNPSKDEASVDVSSLGVNDAVAMLQTTKKAPSYKDGAAKLPAYSVLVLK